MTQEEKKNGFDFVVVTGKGYEQGYVSRSSIIAMMEDKRTDRVKVMHNGKEFKTYKRMHFAVKFMQNIPFNSFSFVFYTKTEPKPEPMPAAAAQPEPEANPEAAAAAQIEKNMQALHIVGELKAVVQKFIEYEICHKEDFKEQRVELKKLIALGLVDRDEDEGFYDLSGKGYRLFKQPMRDVLDAVRMVK